MRTRTVREGSAGLLILLGIALFGGLGLWLRGFNPGNRSYRAIVEFGSARGIQVGTAVRYRGVTVGKITAITPGSNGVDVEIAISPADLIIPRNVSVEAGQSGLIGETFVDIIPLQEIPDGVATGKPLDPNCNGNLIVCNRSRLQGKSGASVDELIRTSIRFTNQFSDPEFANNIKAATRNASEAAAGMARLTNEVSQLTRTLKQEIGTLSGSARTTTNSISRAADQFGLTANQLNSLITANRVTLIATLNNLNQTSNQLRLIATDMAPIISQVKQGELLRNLEALSANSAQASANLRDLSNTLNDPKTVLRLQQTLDSARATFENAQKITSDLDELTGDPAFRGNLRRLINGLSGLVSSTQELEQQAQLAQFLPPLVDQATSVDGVVQANFSLAAPRAKSLNLTSAPQPKKFPLDGSSPAPRLAPKGL